MFWPSISLLVHSELCLLWTLVLICPALVLELLSLIFKFTLCSLLSCRDLDLSNISFPSQLVPMRLCQWGHCREAESWRRLFPRCLDFLPATASVARVEVGSSWQFTLPPEPGAVAGQAPSLEVWAPVLPPLGPEDPGCPLWSPKF